MRLHRLLLFCCACSPVLTDEPATTQQAIWGGQPAPNDHAVFRINNGGAACTASLIAPRTILTADHCAFSGTIVAENLPSSTDVFTVIETQRFTDAYPDAGQVDLSLMFLDRAPPVVPVNWDWMLRMPPVGTKVRHVGYGGTDDGSTGRRTVTVTTGITLFDPMSGMLVLSGNRDAGACYGDSGGPLLLVGADGGDERVLGVVARLAGPECGPVANVLLPHYRAFVEQWLVTHEDAGCPNDGRCVMGCTPVDHDCICGPDGQCTTACPELDDPDCPADCRTNNRCSAEACPRPDTDCTLAGDPCFTPLQCPGRKCVGDPQHAEPYCTGSCDAGCASGWQCDVPRDACIKMQAPEASLSEPCTAGVTLCRSGTCLEGSCRTPCSDDVQCADAGLLCREPAPRYCAPSVTVPALDEQHPAAKGGCSVAAAVPLVLLALLTSRRRRARRCG